MVAVVVVGGGVSGVFIDVVVGIGLVLLLLLFICCVVLLL